MNGSSSPSRPPKRSKLAIRLALPAALMTLVVGGIQLAIWLSSASEYLLSPLVAAALIALGSVLGAVLGTLLLRIRSAHLARDLDDFAQGYQPLRDPLPAPAPTGETRPAEYVQPVTPGMMLEGPARDSLTKRLLHLVLPLAVLSLVISCVAFFRVNRREVPSAPPSATPTTTSTSTTTPTTVSVTTTPEPASTTTTKAQLAAPPNNPTIDQLAKLVITTADARKITEVEWVDEGASNNEPLAYQVGPTSLKICEGTTVGFPAQSQRNIYSAGVEAKAGYEQVGSVAWVLTDDATAARFVASIRSSVDECGIAKPDGPAAFDDTVRFSEPALSRRTNYAIDWLVLRRSNTVVAVGYMSDSGAHLQVSARFGEIATNRLAAL